MMKRLNVLIIILLLLSSCKKVEINEDDQQIIYSGQSDEYNIISEFDPSTTRNYHGTYLGGFDMVEVGKELVERSKAHFDVKTHLLQEGHIIDNSHLSMLVRREATNNPFGLNPRSGTQFDIGNGFLFDDPILVADVVEVDFYQSKEGELSLAGMSVAIVLNQVQKIETSTSITTYEIDDERLLQFAMDVGRKLESYLRTLSDVGDIPIFIGLYSTHSVDSTLPGHFIGEGYFVARSGQFSKVNQKWLIYPSNEVSMIDEISASFFSGFKQTVQTMLPESTGVMGKGRFENEELQYLKIDVQMVAKTYMEIKASSQMIAQMVKQFENRKVHVLVEIKTLNKTVAIIERVPHQDIVNVTFVNG